MKEFEFQHSCGINQLFPNSTGTRIIYIDDDSNGFLYNPISYETTTFSEFPLAKDIIWDQSDKNIVIVYDGLNLHTYVYTPLTVKGASLSKFGEIEVGQNGVIKIVPYVYSLPEMDYAPILSLRGEIKCRSPSKAEIISINSPTIDIKPIDCSLQRVLESFKRNLALHRLDRAFQSALIIQKTEFWLALGNKALQLMNIDIAISVYKQLGDAGMVNTLERSLMIEDKNLLAGKILILFKEYGAAQELFLASSCPIAALEMRRDLCHWEEALNLALKIAPDQKAIILMERAQHEELKCNNQEAQRLFEEANEGINNLRERKKVETYKKICTGGIARTSLRNGNVSLGTKLAKDSDDCNLCIECAGILVSLHQLTDAAQMYEVAGEFEKALNLYIETKDIDNAAQLVEKISSTKVFFEYGRLCEEMNEYMLAVEAYQKVPSLDDIVRLYLCPLDKADEAISIARQSESSSCAITIANFCIDNLDYATAIEFYLLSDKKDLAFDCAKKHQLMDLYAKHTDALNDPEDVVKIAKHFESCNDIGKAGHFYAIAGKFKKSFKLFLQAGEAYLSEAIKVVGDAKDDGLTHKMIDFLMGEKDGQPNYL